MAAAWLSGERRVIARRAGSDARLAHHDGERGGGAGQERQSGAETPDGKLGPAHSEPQFTAQLAENCGSKY